MSPAEKVPLHLRPHLNSKKREDNEESMNKKLNFKITNAVNTSRTKPLLATIPQKQCRGLSVNGGF
jgi:hypothetical protein